MHPAHNKSFDELYSGLQVEVERGMVTERSCQRDPEMKNLRIYNYTDECAYGRAWNEYTLMARGLVLDVEARCVVATPFTKFFNYQELLDADGTQKDPYCVTYKPRIPNLGFEVFEKLDGSLVILFWYNGKWRTCTRGSFDSEQAIWAQGVVNGLRSDIQRRLYRPCTYLLEAIYPENRIVVRYDSTRCGLVFLGGYYKSGSGVGELTYDEVRRVAEAVGWGVAKREAWDSIGSLLAAAKELCANSEGWVLRFENGFRVKIKGDEYCRIHKLVSRITPIAVWECMKVGEDLEAWRKELPEEFLGDFDLIVKLLKQELDNLTIVLDEYGWRYGSLSDKELGLLLQSEEGVRLFPDYVRKLIFMWRKGGEGWMDKGRGREALFKEIRPTSNVLEGYSTGSVLKRVIGEAG